jgi:hypothetical protein
MRSWRHLLVTLCNIPISVVLLFGGTELSISNVPARPSRSEEDALMSATEASVTQSDASTRCEGLRKKSAFNRITWQGKHIKLIKFGP